MTLITEVAFTFEVSPVLSEEDNHLGSIPREPLLRLHSWPCTYFLPGAPVGSEIPKALTLQILPHLGREDGNKPIALMTESSVWTILSLTRGPHSVVLLPSSSVHPD